MHRILSLDPQLLCKKLERVPRACSPGAGDAETGRWVGLLAAVLTQSLSSRFSETLSQNSKVERDGGRQRVPDLRLHTHSHMCTLHIVHTTQSSQQMA